mgnify:FL=1
MDQLQEAKKAIDEKINELAEELGQPQQQDPNALANAQEAAEKAQEFLNDALSELQEPAGLLQELAERQQDIAEALEQQAGEQPEGQQPLDNPLAEAQQEAENAANELAKNNLAEAIGEMKKAEAAIAEAQQGQEPGQEPGQQPGQEPGQQPGQEPGQQPGQQPNLEQLGQEQSDLLTAAEAAQAAQAALEAAPPLENASDLIEPLAAGLEGQLPPQAQQAFDEAVGELADAIEQALANNAVPSQESAQQAQNALAQAAAALSLAEQGAPVSYTHLTLPTNREV